MFNITLQQIKTILTVAEKLNFSESAKEMDISQPSLSQTISRIEESIGLRLFERGKHGVELTSEGEYIYSELKPIYSKICKTFENAVQRNQLRKESLRIVCHTSHLSSGARLYFESFVAEYRQKYPHVTFAEELYEQKDLENVFNAGDADLIFSEAFSLSNIKNIAMKKVVKHQFCVVMAAKHPLAAYDSLQIDKLNDEIFYSVSLYDSQSARNGAYELCSKAGFMPKELRFLSNFPSVLSAVRQGEGMTLSGYSSFLDQDQQIKFFPIPYPPDPTYWVVAWHKDDVSETAMDFINMIPDFEQPDTDAATI